MTSSTPLSLFTTASSSDRKRKRIRYPHYTRSLRKQKAILWKRWKLSNAPEDKVLYKTATVKCKNAIDKFHAAKKLALVRKTTLVVSLVLLIIG